MDKEGDPPVLLPFSFDLNISRQLFTVCSWKLVDHVWLQEWDDPVMYVKTIPFLIHGIYQGIFVPASIVYFTIMHCCTLFCPNQSNMVIINF